MQKVVEVSFCRSGAPVCALANRGNAMLEPMSAWQRIVVMAVGIGSGSIFCWLRIGYPTHIKEKLEERRRRPDVQLAMCRGVDLIAGGMTTYLAIYVPDSAVSGTVDD